MRFHNEMGINPNPFGKCRKAIGISDFCDRKRFQNSSCFCVNVRKSIEF